MRAWQAAVAAGLLTTTAVAGCSSSSRPKAVPTGPPDVSGSMACDGYAHNHGLVYGGGSFGGWRTVESLRAEAARRHLSSKLDSLSGLPGSARLTSCNLFDKSRPQGPPAKIVWLDTAGRTYVNAYDAYLDQVTPSPGGA